MSKREFYNRGFGLAQLALKVLVEDQGKLTPQDPRTRFRVPRSGPRAELLAVVLSDSNGPLKRFWELARDNRTENVLGQLAEQYSIEPPRPANFGKVPPDSSISEAKPRSKKEAFRNEAW